MLRAVYIGGGLSWATEGQTLLFSDTPVLAAVTSKRERGGDVGPVDLLFSYGRQVTPGMTDK